MNFDSLVERRIRKAQEEGVFDKLPGVGQPLDLDDNPFEDPDWRVAFKILKNAKMPPAWIVLGNEIEADWDHCVYERERHGRRIAAEQAAIDAGPVRRAPLRLLALMDVHRRFVAEQRRRVDALNRRIDTFNLTVPIRSLQKRHIRWSDEEARLEALRPRP